jgi:hypothetical protein
MSRGCITWLGGVLSWLVLTAGVASAQSGIAGVARDTSGAVLPGVTVEAASPVLIEKVRSVVTDSEGNYKIIDLRPGVYAVTFSLAGFSTVKRDGIELPAAFTATVNAEMQVGSIEETITVSGAAPLVDVQNVTSQRLLSRDLLESIPAARSPQGFAALTPGVTSQGIGVLQGGVIEQNTAIHGASQNESVWMIDGMSTGSANGTGGQSVVFRIAQVYVSEINLSTGGNTAEYPFGGLVTNIIPREGGNSFSGSLYLEYVGKSFATSNLTENLRAQGFTNGSLSNLRRLWDVSPAVGGRLLRDKLWFFSSYRHFGVIQTRAGTFDNLTPQGWAYTPDLTRPATAKVTNVSRNTRLTWQVTPRNKFSIFVDAAPQTVWQRGYYVASLRLSPEATVYTPYQPNAFKTASWKSPLTNRLLLEAAVAHNAADYDNRRHTPDTCACSAPEIGYDVISAGEATTATIWRSNSTVIAGGPNNYGHVAGHSTDVKGSLSYVTGSHAAKAGLQYHNAGQWWSEVANGSVAYLFRNGLPSSLAQYANPTRYENSVPANFGLFVQDQWTIRRLTLTGGLRYDQFKMVGKPEHLDAGFWVPARDFPGTTLVRWKDLSPRMAAAYDVFGDGKTAVKASFGRFVFAQAVSRSGIGANNAVLRSVLSVTRTWNDANRSLSPDCDLVNPLANGECGQISNLNFGRDNPNATAWDPELLDGLRQYSWETTAVVQRQLTRGVSVSLGYYHRTYTNFTANDNQLVTPADFNQYCITAPVDPRLPGGGGNRICGLYDVSPALFGRNQTVVRDAAHYGTQTQVYDGVDLTESIRLPAGATISGGLNWGRTKTNACFVVDSPGALRFCEIAPPFIPTATFSGFVPLPWWGLVTSATYRDFPGTQITGTYLATNAEIAPSLGRNLSNGVNGTVNVELIQPGTMYGPHARQLDTRLSKRFQIGRRRIVANLDIFNLFNKTGTDTITLQYGPNWQRPTLLQQGRYFKLSGQFDF